MAPQRRESTVERYKHPVPLANIPLRKLSLDHVRNMEKALLKGGMAHKGLELVHTVMSGALKAAMKEDLLTRNVASLVTPHAPDDDADAEMLPPTPAKVMRIIQATRETEESLYPAIHLVSFTGIPRSKPPDELVRFAGCPFYCSPRSPCRNSMASSAVATCTTWTVLAMAAAAA